MNSRAMRLKPTRAKLITDWAACKRAFDKARIPWVMTDGAVLGYVRHKDIMPWDTDLDLGVFCELSAADWQRLWEALRGEGFSLKNSKTEFVYGTRKTRFNLMLFHKKGEFYESFPKGTMKLGLRFVEKAKWYDEPQLVKFLGDIYPVPNHTIDYINAHYGTDWATRIVKDHITWFKEKRQRARKGGDLWPKLLLKNEMP